MELELIEIQLVVIGKVNTHDTHECEQDIHFTVT